MNGWSYPESECQSEKKKSKKTFYNVMMTSVLKQLKFTQYNKFGEIKHVQDIRLLEQLKS